MKEMSRVASSSFVPLLIGATALFLMAACGPDDEEEPEDLGKEELDYEEEFRPDVEEATVESWVRDLEIPWSIVFLDQDTALVSERPGRIRMIVNGELRDEPYLEIAEVEHIGEGGLMGLALSPDFEENASLFAMFTYREDGDVLNKVVRIQHEGESGQIEEEILTDIPGANIHNGGRIRFGPDDKLYITTGDAADKPISRERDNLGGKILRINKDGSIPEGNPFGTEVYSYGHRNPQGLDWHPSTQDLYISEHGPTAHDKLYLLEKGADHGWPEVDGLDPDGTFIDPIVLWPDRSVPPSGMSFHQGDIFIATLRSNALVRVFLDEDQPHKPEKVERWFASEPHEGKYGRFRDVVEGPDGALYVLTSNQDGRGSPLPGDDQIYRITF